ncbi:MAG TPA: TIGR04211 family SH3 domain-containing protein [Steroidobacteraceae bacterium]|nr:TIGR04211 family SH3 domain-containing protein [Steroidobacteraceae bacterium]
MNRPGALLLALLAQAVPAAAAPAYVSDELVLGVYAEQNNQGQRLATLHSGTSVETLEQKGEFTQVRLHDGTTGWVKSAYLTTKEPAIVRVKQLEEELDQRRATTPALAEAAARSEVDRLTRELKLSQADLAAAREAAASAVSPAAAAPAGAFAALPAGGRMAALMAAAAVVLALFGGFWLGYASLARRIRRKFGGLKVY